MSPELKAKVASLRERADRVSKDIRDAESVLREIPITADSDFGPLNWNSQTKRIMMGEKPLIEHKLESRIDGHWYLACLVDRVVLSAEEFMNEAVGS